MTPRKLFIAGSTGAVGKRVVEDARTAGLAVVPHVRPKSAGPATDAQAAVVDLADQGALAARMQGCTTVLQLIGTIRQRFAAGDTYLSSDIGTTQQLLDAAKTAAIDHFILLSSVGAGRPIGAYLKAKAEAERRVVESGIPFTVFRPSAFEGDRHRAVPGMKAFTRALGLRRFEPIQLEELAAALVHVAADRTPLSTFLEGESLLGGGG